MAKANGFDKIALGHHQDDVIETLLLKTFFEGNLASFNPYTYLDRRDLVVIRPFIYVPEAQLAYLARKENLPVLINYCQASGKTKRQDIKEIVEKISSLSPGAKDRAIGSLEKQLGGNWDGKVRE